MININTNTNYYIIERKQRDIPYSDSHSIQRPRHSLIIASRVLKSSLFPPFSFCHLPPHITDHQITHLIHPIPF